MRINPNEIYGKAGSVSNNKNFSSKQEKLSGGFIISSDNLDKIELSHKAEASPARESSIIASKNQTISSLMQDTDSARLDGLKSQIQNGLYNVSSDDIAGAMLSVFDKRA